MGYACSEVQLCQLAILSSLVHPNGNDRAQANYLASSRFGKGS